MPINSFVHFAGSKFGPKTACKLRRMVFGKDGKPKPRKASGQPKPRVVVSKPVTRGKWVPLPVGSDREARFSRARVSQWAREISDKHAIRYKWSGKALLAIWDIVADDYYHLMLEAKKLSELEKRKTVLPRHVNLAGKMLARN